MKKYLVLIFMILSFTFVKAQLTPKSMCGTFMVDLLEGTVNDVKPDMHPARIKEKLPCFTSAETEEDNSGCGVITYKDRDISFYAGRDYVEIGSKFKGKLSLPLMGIKRNGIYKYLGRPKIKDAGWEAYETKYGCMVLYFSSTNLVNKIQFSTKRTETIKLCQ